MHAQRIFHSLCTVAFLTYCGLYFADYHALPPYGRLLLALGGCTFLAALTGLQLHFFVGRTSTSRTATTVRSSAVEASCVVEQGIRWWFFILPIPFYREIYSAKGATYEVEICNGEVTKLEHFGRQVDSKSKEGESVLRQAEPHMRAVRRQQDSGASGWLN